jgi:hypothetical protein
MNSANSEDLFVPRWGATPVTLIEYDNTADLPPGARLCGSELAREDPDLRYMFSVCKAVFVSKLTPTPGA